MEKNEYKDYVLKRIKDYNADSLPSIILYGEVEGNVKIKVKTCIEELINEGLITEIQKFLSLTDDGFRVSNIGYIINANYIKEKHIQKILIEDEKQKLELKALQFNDTWKWTIIIGFLIAVGSFVVSILAYLKP